MANNKNLKIKNGLQAGRYLGSNGTEIAGANGPYGTFSTDLYTGNGSTQTITNGIDLAGEGGLVWQKGRSLAYDHQLTDTERGAGNTITTVNTSAEATRDCVDQFNSDGFLVGGEGDTNASGQTYVSWTFRKAPKFFDVVTYTGNGSNRSIAHDLDCEVGMLIVKCTSNVDDWWVYHRGANTSNAGTAAGKLNENAGFDDPSDRWNSTAPTSTHFYLESGSEVNGSGRTYVAYLFAHDTSADSNIKCGSFTTDSGSLATVDLGFEPSWVMYKKTNGTGQWYIEDTMRGLYAPTQAGNTLIPNLSNAEGVGNGAIHINSSGFETKAAPNNLGASNTFIYMAISAVVQTQTLDLSTGHTFSITPTEALDILFSNPPASGTATGFSVEVDNTGGYAITWPSSVKWHLGTAPTATASKELYTFITTDGGTTYYGKKSAEIL